MKGVLDVNNLIRMNPSVEGGEDEGANDQTTKVIDIIDTFRHLHLINVFILTIIVFKYL